MPYAVGVAQLRLISAKTETVGGKLMLHARLTGPSETNLMMHTIEHEGKKFAVKEVTETGWGNPEHTFDVEAEAI